MLMMHNSLNLFLLMSPNQGLTFLLLRRRLEISIYLHNSLPIFIISNRKHLLLALGNKWKLNNIHLLYFLPLNLLLHFLIPLTLIVILLHRSEFTIIIHYIRHTLPLLVNWLLNLLILPLYYLVDLPRIDQLVIRRLFLLMSIGRIETDG